MPGLVGGYGCPSYPLARITGVDVFETFKTDPGAFRCSIEELMNERPFADAQYSTHPMTLPFHAAKSGELYMIAQGSGGGFGDPLERDPAGVMQDLDDALISDDVAWRIYRVVYDVETRVIDSDATAEARDAARKEPLAAAKPFAAFSKTWTKDGPSGEVPYYGCWDDKTRVYAGNPAETHPAGNVNPPVLMPHPMQVQIDRLQAELDACRKQNGAAGK